MYIVAKFAGRIEMSLGIEVGLSPSHIVLDADPAPHPESGTAYPPIFSPCLFCPNGWMDQECHLVRR